MKRTCKRGKLQSSAEVESRGVSTSRSTRSTITPTASTPAGATTSTSTPTCATTSTNTPTSVHTSTNTPTSVTTSTSATTSINTTPSNILFNYAPTSLSSGKESPTKVTYRDSPSKASHSKDSPIKASHSKDSPSKASHSKDSPSKASHSKDSPSKASHSKDSPSKASHSKDSPSTICNSKDIHVNSPYYGKDSPTKTSHSKEKSQKDGHTRDDANRDNHLRKGSKESSGSHRTRSGHFHKRHSYQEVQEARLGGPGPRAADLVEATTASVKQELLHLSLARQALQAEKMELTRLLEQREGVITELRKQMHQRDQTIQAQRSHIEDVLRNVQNGKRVVGRGDSPAGRLGVSSATKEDLHLVRDAIVSLRSNFRETDPNQHTLDTLEQAIAILIERGSGGGSGGGGGGSGGTGSVGGSPDKTSRPGDKRLPLNGVVEVSTKVIYFTERTVTPFMSTINKRLGEIRLRDFKNMFDRPGLFRFHFKSYDPEYGLVKEEIVNEDDILPGVDGKIIAWVEEDVD